MHGASHAHQFRAAPCTVHAGSQQSYCLESRQVTPPPNILESTQATGGQILPFCIKDESKTAWQHSSRGRRQSSVVCESTCV